MKHYLAFISAIIFLSLLHMGIVNAAPTSTPVQNLIITGLKSSPTAHLTIDANGLVATSTAGSGGSGGGVTTSSAGTTNSLPIWTSAFALGNSTISQPGGGLTSVSGIPILDGGGDFIGPNILMSATSSVVVGNLVQNGGVTPFNTTTTLTGAQFCGTGLAEIVNTTGSITILLPTTSTIYSSSPCGATIWTGSFAQQYMRNDSTNTVFSAINGSNEIQVYSPGTPTSLAPGQEWFITGQFENTSTQLAASSTATNLVVKYQLVQTSTPLTINGNTVTVSGALQDGQNTKYVTSTGITSYNVNSANNFISVSTTTTNATLTYSSSSLNLGLASTRPSSDFLSSSTVVNNPSSTVYGAGYGLGASGSLLAVSSTFASTTLSIVIPDPTSTLPYKYSGQVYFPYKFNLAQIRCNEWGANASATVNVFRGLDINTSTIDSNIATLTCGNLTTSTVTFTTSTIPVGSVIYAAVTSTAGTAQQVSVQLIGTKL